jgi:heme-degrading monooxygenase HmoA
MPLVPRLAEGAQKEPNMIAVFVRFRYESGFSEAQLRQVADQARTKFEGMPGLRSKAFTIDPVHREALNVYVWDSEEAAKAFFSPQLMDMVTGLYGVRPTVDFVEVAALVENRAS